MNVLSEIFLAPKAAQGVIIFVPLFIHSFISLFEALNLILDLDSFQEHKNIYMSRAVQWKVPHPAKM